MRGRVDPWCRAIAWGAMVAGSLLPTILSRSAGEEGYSVPVAQVLVLVVASVIVGRSSRLRVLSGFLLTIAVVRLGWSVIAPIVAEWAPVHGFMDDLDWGPKMFVTRLLYVAGALLMLTTFIGRRITRADLFLRVGNLNAPVKPERILWFRSPLRWWHLGPLIVLIFALAMIAFLFSSLRPNFWQLTQHWQLFPWAVATAALNAANEEFQFRCVPLAHLRNVLPLREARLVNGGFLRTRPLLWATIWVARRRHGDNCRIYLGQEHAGDAGRRLGIQHSLSAGLRDLLFPRDVK